METVSEDVKAAPEPLRSVDAGPPQPQVRAPSKLAPYNSEAASASGISAGSPVRMTATTKTASGKPILPPNWQAFQDDDGKTYYYNSQTGKTSWDPPALVAPVVANNAGGGGGESTPRM